jgi:hypothetical protein
MSKTLTKQPSESRIYTMDFSANLIAGETIVSVDSVTGAPSGLTIAGGIISSDGKQVQNRISGGAAGTVYKITLVVTTSLSNVLEGEGALVVKDL